jgi:hypothetical protein
MPNLYSPILHELLIYCSVRCEPQIRFRSDHKMIFS